MSKTMNTPERIRIKDIAKMADVSVGTVDRVIHGRSGVSEASRKRVEEILEKLNYQPNMYASALASNKKYAFACLLPQHETGEYWTEVESADHLLGFQHHREAEVLRPVRLPLLRPGSPQYRGNDARRCVVCPHCPAVHHSLYR